MPSPVSARAASTALAKSVSGDAGSEVAAAGAASQPDGGEGGECGDGGECESVCHATTVTCRP